MADDSKNTVSLTRPARLFLPTLFEARAIGPKGREQGKPKFSANFGLAKDSPDVATLKDAAIRVAKEQWPGRDLKTIKLPLTLGDKLADRQKEKGKNYEFYRGLVILIARSQYEPKLSVIEGGKVVEYLDERRAQAKPKFYSGVEALCQVTFKAYTGIGENPDGVTAYLDLVASLNRGERVGSQGGPAAADVFKGYIGLASAEDPTGDADEDEIEF